MSDRFDKNMRKTWKSKLETTSYNRVCVNNVRERNVLKQQISTMTNTTVKNVKKLQNDMFLLRKELLVNKLAVDLKEKYKNNNEGASKPIYDREKSKFRELPQQKTRSRSLANLRIDLAKAMQYRARSVTNQDVSSRRAFTDKDVQLEQFEVKHLSDRWSLFSLGYSPNQLRRQQNLNSDSNKCLKTFLKDNEHKNVSYNHRKRNSTSVLSSLHPISKITNGVSDLDSHSKRSLSATRVNVGSGSSNLTVFTSRKTSADYNKRKMRRFSLPNPISLQNFARLSVGEHGSKKLSAKLPFPESNVRQRKNKKISPVIFVERKDVEETDEPLEEDKGTEDKDNSTNDTNDVEEEVNACDQQTKIEKTGDYEDLFYAFQDISGLLTNYCDVEDEGLANLPKITLEEKIEKFFLNYPSEMQTFDRFTM